MTLRETIEAAIHQLATYKQPDVDEAQKLLSGILEAAGFGSIMRDELIRLDEYNDEIHIDILDAEDPIRTAKIWGLNRRIDEQQNELNTLRGRATWYEDKLNELKAELEAA